MSDDRDELAPAEAFGVLGDENRVAILETLAEALQAGETGLSFSALRERVGIRDAGQFNYHLSKLRDQFVVKRDDGYYPRYAALRAVGAMRAGTYTDRPESRTADIDHPCPECGRLVSATYDRGFVSMTCPEHEKVFQTTVPPRAAADRSVPELVAFANAELQRDVERLADGTCFVCWGPVTVGEPYHSDTGRLHVTLSCEDCWLKSELAVAATVVRHPAVVAFYYDHGIDVRTEPFLSLDLVSDTESASVVEEEPLRMVVELELDGESLALTLDADLNVLEVEES